MQRRLLNHMEEQNKNEDAEQEILDFNKPNFEFIPKGVHEWRQQGYYIICKSCDLEHATWIGPDKILTGIKETGDPILKVRT